MVKVLMRMKTATELASVRPKPWFSLKSAPGTSYVCRSRLALVGIHLAVVVVHVSLQTSRFSPNI